MFAILREYFFLLTAILEGQNGLEDKWAAIQKDMFINTVFIRLIRYGCFSISKHYLGKAGILEISGIKTGLE
jgi:hypothetical protein